MRMIIFASFFTFGIYSTGYCIEPDELSSWKENECAVSCGYEKTTSTCLKDSTEALKYVQYVILDQLFEKEKETDNSCICVTAKLNMNGTFSEVSIYKSNDIEFAKIFKSKIEKLNLPTAPASASCLTKELMKFSSGKNGYTPNNLYMDSSSKW